MEYDRKEDYLHIKWAKSVKDRDFYTCQICGLKSELHSHHLNAYNLFPEERYDISNGTTICIEHHEMFHSIYGKGNNTALQFEEYKLMLAAIEKVATKDARIERATKFIIQMLESGEEPESNENATVVQICTA